MKKRIGIYLIGIFIFTLGIGLSIQSGWGVGPWDATFVASNDLVPLTVGTWSILIQILLLLFSALLVQKRPSYESGITILVRGVFLDVWLYLVFPLLGIQKEEMNLWMGALGLLLLGTGIGLYLVSNLPKTPIDVFMNALQEKMKWSMKKARLVVECVALIMALVLSGPVGIGTVATAFLLAPIIQVSNAYFGRILHKKKISM